MRETGQAAKGRTRRGAGTHKFLNAGRGNPNWLATSPREAFFLLGHFAIGESKRTWDEPDFGGMPQRPGIAVRFHRFLSKAGTAPGADLLIVIGLAKLGGSVLLNGSGFDGPPWSVRISLANLDADAYVVIGRDLRELARRLVSEWRAVTRA